MPKPNRVRQVLAGAIMLSVSAAGFAGCTSKPTEIVSGVTTQLQVPKFLQSVGVVVQLGGRLIFCESYDVVDGTVTLPSTLGTVPQENGDASPSDPVTIQILGFRTPQAAFSSDCVASIPDVGEQEVFVVRRRRLPYVDDRILYLPMPLRESCSDVDCPDDQTCIGSLCESMDVDPGTLQDYRDDYVFGNTNTCFNASLCADDKALVPTYIVDEDTCTFRTAWPDDAPQPGPGMLNVRIIYDSFAAEILDLDAKEGFVFPDVNDPLTFRLASNMCEGAYKNGRIIAVQASPLCSAKTPLQPICADDLAEILDGSNRVAGSDVNLCTLAAALEQTESALYVLLDAGQPMAQYFGPDGFAFAVETPLESPIAARTRVGFATVPAASCAADNDYLTPTIGFANVDAVREPIGEFLLDTNNLVAGDDINLESAMKGAYQALAGQTPDTSTQFNRRALIYVGNRQLEGNCALPGESPAELAAAALASPDEIYTYVAALDAPGGTVNVGDPVSAGGAIASAGGTQLFDAINDPLAGPTAVTEVINDLGSCLYDAPPMGTFPGDVLPDDANLSYLNPIDTTRTDVPKNDQCVAGSTQSGWNQEGPGEPVRICGQACADLRAMLNDVAEQYGIIMQPAPRVPVLVTVPCNSN